MPLRNNFNALSPAARGIVADYAERRGIGPDHLDEFLNPEPDLDRWILPDGAKAIARLSRAVGNSEHVLVFGDYDADGITATAILLRFLRETASFKVSWSLPDRRMDQYGLDLAKAGDLVSRYRPSLLVCVDCGTTSGDAIAWLKTNGVETIVVDHHPPENASTEAVAVVNPKAHPASEGRDLDELCAAGLALLLCNQLAKAWNCSDTWDSSVATLLAGLGTIADSVPMTVVNRAIAKRAIALINDPVILTRIPGLAAIVPADGQRLTQRRLQFEVIPALNALGRLASAEPGVTLLTTTDRAEAEKIAADALKLNANRKAMQQEMTDQAAALARGLLENHPDAPVLVLADQRWHHGVAGPTASRIAEQFGRSAILLAPGGAEGRWKGSGRSCQRDDLGRWIRKAKALGLVDRGGGHASAVGLAVPHGQIAALQIAGLTVSMPQDDNHEAETEIIGNLDQLAPQEWIGVIELLEPFGFGNPFPRIAADDAFCEGKPMSLTLRDSGKVWGMKAEFRTKAGQIFAPVWRDAELAFTEWMPGNRYDLEMEVTAKGYNGRIYYNWAVTNSRKSSFSAGSNPNCSPSPESDC